MFRRGEDLEHPDFKSSWGRRCPTASSSSTGP
jgi:hypothetical protein